MVTQERDSEPVLYSEKDPGVGVTLELGVSVTLFCKLAKMRVEHKNLGVCRGGSLIIDDR